MGGNRLSQRCARSIMAGVTKLIGGRDGIGHIELLRTGAPHAAAHNEQIVPISSVSPMALSAGVGVGGVALVRTAPAASLFGRRSHDRG